MKFETKRSEELCQKLNLSVTPSQPQGDQDAGVLILLHDDGSEDVKVLLCVRSRHLRRHPGEVCFPGGMMDMEDGGDVRRTAIREAYEEVGVIETDDYEVLGSLPAFRARFGILIHPTVALARFSVIFFIDFNVSLNFGIMTERRLKMDMQRRVDRKDASLKFGETYRVPQVKKVLEFSDEHDDYIETGLVICTQCTSLLTMTDGNHVKRHVMEKCKKRKILPDSNSEPVEKTMKITDYNYKKLKESEVQKISLALARYCLKSGKSFHHVASDCMKSLIVEVCNSISVGYGDVARKQLPCRSTVQNLTENLSKQLLLKAGKFMEPYKSRIHLAVDHGKLVVQYLSIFATFLDKQLKLQVVPIAFTPAIDGKSGKQTADLIIERMISFGWEESDICATTVTADGALSTIGNYFSGYIRCVSHSINLVAQKAIHPLEAHKLQLAHVMPEIKTVCEILDAAAHLASAIRLSPTTCENLSKLPRLSCETRWMSNVHCLSDVFELMPEIQKSSTISMKGRQGMNKMIDNISIVRSILLFYEPLLKFNTLFQAQNEVTIHLVLPAYKILEKTWNKWKDEQFEDLDEDLHDISILNSIATTGLVALNHYYTEFTDTHFAAVLLAPGTKSMKLFSFEESEKARECVLSMMPLIPNAPSQPTSSTKPNLVAQLYQSVSDRTEHTSASSELARYMGEFHDAHSDETIEMYWKRKELEYPALFSVAVKIFSTVPSEAMCETAFSTASFLLDKRRTRLQYKSAELVVLGCQIATKFPQWLED